MKFGNRRKKEAVVGRPLIDNRGGSSVRTDYAHGRPSPVSWEYQQEGSTAPQKKGLLNKLNCGASSKYDEEALYAGGGFTPYRPTKEQPTYVSPTQQHYSSSKSVRPVLITVKDGDMYYQPSTNEPQETLEFKSTFLVGPEGEIPEARRVTPERRKQKSYDKDPRRRSPDRRRRKDENEGEERKDRWRKGVQSGWKDDGDLGSRMTYGEESTYADTTTANDDSLYESDSFESSCESSRPRQSKKRNSRRRRSKSLTNKNNNKSVFGSVAEDLGVVAKMLLSDGTACFSSAAEITRETIVSCKTQV